VDTAFIYRIISASIRLHEIHSRYKMTSDAAYYLGFAHAFEEILRIQRGETTSQEVVDDLERRLQRELQNLEGRETP